MNLPTDLQWQELFGISEELRSMEPWQRYCGSQLFMIEKNGEEPVFCAILGQQQDFYGVSLYRGYKSLNGYLKILDAGEDVPFQTVLSNQKCVTVYFGEVDILGPGDYTAMQRGGYTPKFGTLGHIFFRTYSPGLSPWYICEEEAAFAIETLRVLRDMLNTLEEKSLRINDGEVACAKEFQDAWEIAVCPLPHFEINEDYLEVKDELMVAKLKRLPRVAGVFELDDTFLPNPVSGKGNFRPLFPRICIFADHDEGTIERQVVLDEDENHISALYHLLTQSLMEIGRPRLLIIRKNSILPLVEDLCKKIHVPIEERISLEIIDDFLGLIGNFDSES